MNPSDQARQVGVVDSWLAQVEVWLNKTNPGDGTTLIDTGALPAGYYDVFYGAAFTTAVAMNNLDFQHRNAANSSSLCNDGFVAAAAGSLRGSIHTVKVAANERFRFYTQFAYTGTMICWILAIRRA